jgi:predicted DNA-binding protein (UPF0251 family)
MHDAVPNGEEARQASLHLPERQRDALSLREVEGLPYEEIASALGTSRHSVAQLLVRARINLYDELRGTALASGVAPSAECERALPLIAAREDGELGPESGDEVTWLDSHLTDCDRCQLAAKQMADVTASFGPAAPVAAGVSSSTAVSLGAWWNRPGRRRIAIGASLAALAFAATAMALGGGGDRQGPGHRAADDAVGTAGHVAASAKGARAGGVKGSAKHRVDKRKAEAQGGTASPGTEQGTETLTPVSTPADSGTTGGGVTGGGGDEPTLAPAQPGGKTTIQPSHQTSSSKPTTKSQTPASQSAPQSTSPPPAEETTPPAEEPPDEPGHREEAPGKHTGRPPQ